MDGFESTIDRSNIIVQKVTDPTGSTQSFDFTTNYGGGTFSLTDGQSYDSGALDPTSEGGTYSVSETVPAGWSQTSATCDDGSPVNAIDLGPGETVTCTFTNTIDRSNIIVLKVTDPPGSTQSFDFWTNYGGGAFSLTDGQSNDSGGLVQGPAPFWVYEDPVPGWDLTSATCDDGSPVDAIDLAPGETVTCTFTNTIDRGNIVVQKVTDQTGSTQSFDFTTNYGGGAFSLTDGQSNDSGALVPTSEGGTYSVSETVPAGWSQTSATCDDGSPIDAIDLGPGETVTCTFTNTPNTCPCWEESELQVITAANIAFPASVSCDPTHYPNYLGMADVDAIIAFEAVSNPNGPSGPVLSCGAYDNTPYWQDATMAEADICIAQLARRCADIGYPVNGN